RGRDVALFVERLDDDAHRQSRAVAHDFGWRVTHVRPVHLLTSGRPDRPILNGAPDRIRRPCSAWTSAFLRRSMARAEAHADGADAPGKGCRAVSLRRCEIRPP